MASCRAWRRPTTPWPGSTTPAPWNKFETSLARQACLPRVPCPPALARGLRMPALQTPAGALDDGAGLSPLPRLPGRGVADRGSLFERTHKPLRLWFRAMWYVTSQKSGVSALGLQRVLGLGSYRTAWAWLHKLRRAMVRPGRDRCRGGWRWMRPTWEVWRRGAGVRAGTRHCRSGGRRRRQAWVASACARVAEAQAGV